MTSLIVQRSGKEAWEESVRGIEGLCVQLLQICRDYQQLPPVRELTIPEIRFFYNGLRRELMGVQGGG